MTKFGERGASENGALRRTGDPFSSPLPALPKGPAAAAGAKEGRGEKASEPKRLLIRTFSTKDGSIFFLQMKVNVEKTELRALRADLPGAPLLHFIKLTE